MTPIQQKIYLFIQSFIEENGYAPLLKEIAIGVGISPNSKSFISRCVHKLVDKGLLHIDDEGRPRNIELARKEKTFQLPLIGRIAAGSPIEAIPDMEALDLTSLFSTHDHFILKVKGDSMIEEGILDGDNIICKQQVIAREGDIVVALIDNQNATLKRIRYQSKDDIILLPANAALLPQIYARSRVQIQGIFVGLLRLKG